MQKIRITNALAFLLLIAFSGQLQAQQWFQYSAPPREFDWQLFSPEVDWECEKTRGKQGYFGNLERTHTWMLRPERAPIGVESDTPVNVFVPANVNYVYFGVTDAMGNVIIPAADLSLLQPFIDGGSFGVQTNTVDDSYTETGTGWGNRAEFGWVNGRNGWMMSLLSSRVRNSSIYGADDKRQNQLGSAQGLDGRDAIDDPSGVGIFQPQPPVSGIPAIPGVDGLYSVHVLFEDPFGLLLGFVDLDGDLLSDDLDGGGVNIGLPGADGSFTDDFLNGGVGDRVRIGVVFDDMFVENEMEVSGIEISAIRRKKPLGAGAFAEMYLGARYLELDDRLHVLARGGVLQDTEWDNNAINRLVGPQIGFRVTNSASRWTTQLQARFMAAANFMSIRQKGKVGDHLARTGLNGTFNQAGLPTSLGGNDFFHRFSDSYFSPTGEFRVESAVQLTKFVSFKAGWTGLVAGNITRANNTVRYRVPDFGIRASQQELFSSTASLGFEINR